jgi:hypothetical protein
MVQRRANDQLDRVADISLRLADRSRQRVDRRRHEGEGNPGRAGHGPRGTPDGLYQVTFQMHSATGTPLPAVVEKIAVSATEAVRPRLSRPPALARG